MRANPGIQSDGPRDWYMRASCAGRRRGVGGVSGWVDGGPICHITVNFIM